MQRGFGAAFRRRMNYSCSKAESKRTTEPAGHTARPRTQDRIVNKRILWIAFQYLLAVSLLSLLIY